MNLTITEITPMGYGNPESTISYDKQLLSGELTADVAARSREIITEGECLKEVNNSDDGCIDGRPSQEVLCANEQGEFYTKPVDNAAGHIREKVAGGGYITGYAMQLGLGLKGESVESDLLRVGELTESHKVCCGAHTGAHAGSDTTDCGANDKVALILSNGNAFRDKIAAHTQALLEAGGASFENDAFNKVIDNWAEATKDDAYFSASSGKERFNAIQENIKAAQQADGGSKAVSVSKNLSGSHNEDFIIINYVDGHSFSQADFTAKLAENFPDTPADKTAQAFAVDVPRVMKLAKAVGGDDQQRVSQALHAGVAYQLSTAATLTDGSLPIFLIQAS